MAALSTENGAESIQLAVERLRTLDGEGLRLEWRNLFGKRAPKALPKSCCRFPMRLSPRWRLERRCWVGRVEEIRIDIEACDRLPAKLADSPQG